MTSLFLRLLNISMTASWIVLAVVLVRLLLRKAPKWISCLLWVIVALRLIVPVFPESYFSLIPSTEVISQEAAADQMPVVQTDVPAVNITAQLQITEQAPQMAAEDWLRIAAGIWLVGVAGFLIYSLVAYWRLRRSVRASILQEKNVYICDEVESPFILGVFRPRIYVPSGLEEPLLKCVLAHERAHLKRKDHWWKPLGFVLLAIYWCNPFLWLAYILLCRDIESACDEKAVREMDSREKLQYSQALILCSVPRRMIMACPVAFGEVAVKDRIKGILRYKKPAVWIVAASVAVCVVASVCLLTNPKTCIHEYTSRITAQSTCAQAGTEQLTCSKCDDSYTAPVPLIAHSYDEGTVLQPADCIRTGCRELTCTACGDKTTQTIALTAHTAGTTQVIKEANCTEEGRLAVTCTVCQSVYETQIPKDGAVHELKETVVRAANCTAAGEGVLTCAYCDYSETCTYPQHSHSPADYGLLSKTCYTHQRQQICTVCGLVWTVSLNDYGHNFVSGRCTRCYMKQPNTNLFESTTSTTTNSLPGAVVWDVAGSTNPTRDLNAR